MKNYILFLATALLLLTACGPAPLPNEEQSAQLTAVSAEATALVSTPTPEPTPTSEPLPGELTFDQIDFTLTSKGSGENAIPGRIAEIHLVGKLEDGSEFFSSRTNGQTVMFPIAAQNMLPAIDLAIQNMKVGDQATLVLPPAQAFGEDGGGVVPPGSTVTIELEFVAMPDIEYEEITAGEGPQIKIGDMVMVHYRGTLEDGTEFDSSYSRNEPFQVLVGSGGVIPGWELGLQKMRVGGKGILTIPPGLAYGDREIPGIPANSTLIFEIEVVELVVPPAQPAP